MVYPALLPLMRTPRLPVFDWTDAPADLNGLVLFDERQNLVSARVPSHFKRSLQEKKVVMLLMVEKLSALIFNLNCYGVWAQNCVFFVHATPSDVTVCIMNQQQGNVTWFEHRRTPKMSCCIPVAFLYQKSTKTYEYFLFTPKYASSSHYSSCS